MSEIHAANAELTEKVKQLEQSYGSLKNSTGMMLATIPDIQSLKLAKAKILDDSFRGNLTTEQDRNVLGKSTKLIHLGSSIRADPFEQTKQQIFVA